MTPTDPDNQASQPHQAVIPKGLIRPDERVILAIKPSGVFVLLVSAHFWAWLVIILAAAWAYDRWGIVKMPMSTLLPVAAAAALARLLLASIQWLCRTYVLTDRRIIRVKGVLWVRIFECGLSRVQNTALSLPLAQRVLGAGTIYFATAGTAGRDAAWLIVARPKEVHQTVAQWVQSAQSSAGPTVP
jgi:hypothetical protein